VNQKGRADQSVSALSDQLLLTVAEQLKLPLLQIARSAELAQKQKGTADLATIQTTADMAIRLLDSYLFGARLALEDDYRLQLEPVSVSSVLYDTERQLAAMAKLYGVELQLDIAGQFGPVQANRQALQAALTSLGYALIEALPSLNAKKLTLKLAVHNSRYGVVAGIYSDVEQVTTEALRQGRKLHGHIRQPLATLSPSSGAGVFVADAIFQAMDTELQPTRHHNLHGLGAVLRPTPQLQLV
jgi:hypothetical protein